MSTKLHALCAHTQLLPYSEFIDGSADARQSLWAVIVANEAALDTELGPVGGDIGLGGVVGVLGVDEDEVVFSPSPKQRMALTVGRRFHRAASEPVPPNSNALLRSRPPGKSFATPD